MTVAHVNRTRHCGQIPLFVVDSERACCLREQSGELCGVRPNIDFHSGLTGESRGTRAIRTPRDVHEVHKRVEGGALSRVLRTVVQQ